MNVSPALAARQIAAARAERATQFGGDRLAYSTHTGDALPVVTWERRQESAQERWAKCSDLAKYGEHVLTHVEADLPGDRSVGFCICGQYIDTGTFDERNA